MSEKLYFKCIIINLIFSQQFGYGYFTSGKLNPYKYIHCYINIPITVPEIVYFNQKKM